MTADEYRAALQRMVSKVPPSIGSASVQTVRAYKKAVVAAQKTLEKSRPTLEALQSAHNTLASFF